MNPFRSKLFRFVLCLFCLALELAAQTNDSIENSERQFTYTDALILGLVEGITEYLPVSSTGHLILTNALLGLNSEVPLPDKNGAFIWIDDPSATSGQRYFTLENAADAYVIIIQFGAIAAVALLYWRRLLTIIMGILGKDTNGLKLLRNLIIAFIPAAILGLILNDWIESVLFGVLPVVTALTLGAVLMLVVEHCCGKRQRGKTGFQKQDDGPDLHQLNIKQCLTVGFLQCIAMWPGTSRSMMTIVGGYIIGLNPVRAAEFSFLLGLITLSAASAYKTLSVGPLIIQTVPLGPLLIGVLVATASAALAVKWLVSFLTRHGLSPFAWYRLGLALLVLLTFA